MLEHAGRYLADLERREGISPRTVDQYRYKLKQYERWAGARTFDRAAVLEYLRYLQTERGLAARTIRISCTALRSHAAWLKAHRLPAPRLDHVPLPRRGPPDRYTPTDEEVKALFETAQKLPAYNVTLEMRKGRTLAALSIFACCGLRTGELLGLRVQDVKRAGAEWFVHVAHGKGSQIRDIPLSAEARRHVEAWVALRSAWAARREMREPAASGLFPVDRARVMDYKGLRRLWDELLAFAELSDRRIQRHSMRHWFLSAVEAEEGLATAQELAGHSNKRTTLEYLHSNSRRRRRGVEAVSEIVRTRSADLEPKPCSYGVGHGHGPHRLPAGSARKLKAGH